MHGETTQTQTTQSSLRGSQPDPARRGAAPPLVAAAVGVVAMGLLVAATIWGEYAHAGDGPLVIDVTIGAVACCLFAVMLRWPVAGALVLAGLAALSPAATPPATFGTLLVARVRHFPLALVTGTAGVAAHAVRGLWRPVDGISFGWWLVLVGAAHAALLGWGTWSRARWALIAALRERAQRAEAEQGRRVAEARAGERARIAREMHDVLAHRLSLLATYAGAIEYRPDAPPEKLSRAAAVIRSSVHQALDELREVIALLRDDAPGDGADAMADGRPQPTLPDIRGLVEESRAAGMRVEVDNRLADLGLVPSTTGRTAYRIVQEGLTNARKHAAGQPVTIRLDGAPGSALVIEVSNPWPERLPREVAIPGTGTGLVGLTERARLAGGQLDHQLGVDGFRLHASLPWPV